MCFLVYGGEEELIVTSYTEASFQTDKDDSKSQPGYVFTINGGAVRWKSSKQETVADSTTEVEYMEASVEVIPHLARLLVRPFGMASTSRQHSRMQLSW